MKRVTFAGVTASCARSDRSRWLLKRFCCLLGGVLGWLAAVGWVSLWVAVPFLPVVRDMDVVLLAALLAGTSLLVGRVTGTWWAMLLPLLVIPVVSLPQAYTPGAEPDYSIGLFVAAIVVLIATPVIAIGVALSHR